MAAKMEQTKKIANRLVGTTFIGKLEGNNLDISRHGDASEQETEGE